LVIAKQDGIELVDGYTEDGSDHSRQDFSVDACHRRSGRDRCDAVVRDDRFQHQRREQVRLPFQQESMSFPNQVGVA
jgi:hypothetical protein